MWHFAQGWPFAIAGVANDCPDVTPIIGYTDDALLVILVLHAVAHRAGPDALERHWPGTPAGLGTLRSLTGLAPR